jgi:hypothetical protein
LKARRNTPINALSTKFLSGNRKSAIQNPKWVVGIFAIFLTLVFGGAVANAQQPGKSSASVSWKEALLPVARVVLTAFRQELSKLGWIEGKNITIE